MALNLIICPSKMHKPSSSVTDLRDVDYRIQDHRLIFIISRLWVRKLRKSGEEVRASKQASRSKQGLSVLVDSSSLSNLQSQRATCFCCLIACQTYMNEQLSGGLISRRQSKMKVNNKIIWYSFLFRRSNFSVSLCSLSIYRQSKLYWWLC